MKFYPTYFSEYFIQNCEFSKLLWNFPPYILGNIFQTLETLRNYCRIFTNIFQGIFHTNWGIFPIMFWGIFPKNWKFSKNNVKLSSIYFENYFPNIVNSKLLWNFPQHISGNIPYKLGNFPYHILGNISEKFLGEKHVYPKIIIKNNNGWEIPQNFAV